MIMKKILCLVSLAMVAVTVLSCHRQDADPSGAETKFSDVAYLMDGLLVRDEAGNIRGYNFGACLNQANPYEISVPVDSYDEAVRIFLSLLPKGVQPAANGAKLIWTMTDQKGNPEGEAVLVRSSDAGVLAVLTVGTSQLNVRFVSIWPENADDFQDYMDKFYSLGTVVNKPEVPDFGEGDFVIIQQWTPQECGIMIQPEAADYTCESIGEKSSLPSGNLLHRVYAALHARYDFSTVLGSLNYQYLTNLSREASAGTEYCAVNLDNDQESWLLSTAVSPVRKVRVYCFAPEGNKIKCWSSTNVVDFIIEDVADPKKYSNPFGEEELTF